eukprot:UN02231
MQIIGIEIFKNQNQNKAPNKIVELKKSDFYLRIKQHEITNPNIFYVLINLQVDGLQTSICSIWQYDVNTIKDTNWYINTWKPWLENDDTYKNARFKLYATVEGSWTLTKMLPQVPTLMGQKVPITYLRGPNYIDR